MCDGVGCWFCKLCDESKEMYDQATERAMDVFNSQNNVGAKMATQTSGVDEVIKNLRADLAAVERDTLLWALLKIPQVQKISRIKEVRAATGLNLKDAKGVMDVLSKEIPSFRSEEEELACDRWSRPFGQDRDARDAEYERRIANLQIKINSLIDEKCTAQDEVYKLKNAAHSREQHVQDLVKRNDDLRDGQHEAEEIAAVLANHVDTSDGATVGIHLLNALRAVLD